jgi:hypothetical protein
MLSCTFAEGFPNKADWEIQPAVCVGTPAVRVLVRERKRVVNRGDMNMGALGV